MGVVDMFCGCGGVSAGFLQADVPGVDVGIVAGVDHDAHCCETYESMIGAPALKLDIAELVDDPDQMDDLVGSWRLGRFDKVVLIGCAPCQGFAAHRKAVEGKDERRNLFVIFCELAARMRPDAVFMENVPDLFSKRHWPYYEAGRGFLEDAGYTVHGTVYNFAGFGLPQERFRAVMMAFPHPFALPEPPLAPEGFRTVRDAIGHLPLLGPGEQLPLDPMHKTSRHRQSTIDVLKQVPVDGGNRPVGVGPKCLDKARRKHGGYTDVYGRLAWDKPAVTITSRCRTPSCGRFAHPEQHRGLSIREAALLQGFPEDYQFEGPFDDKFKQIGNAVSPTVAEAMGEHIFQVLASDGDVAGSNEVLMDVTEPVGPGFAVTINGIKRRRESKLLEA